MEPGPTPAIEDPAAPATSPRVQRLDRSLEAIGVALLSIAALASSWASYEAERWSGVQAGKYSTANGLWVESSRATTTAGQQAAVDVALFTNWLNAYATGNGQLQDFYRTRFRPEFAPAFEAWFASVPRHDLAAAPTPFETPRYRLSERERAAQLEADAARTFSEGEAANQRSDDYVLATVLLSSVLFFAGISQPIHHVALRAFMLGVATVLCAVALYRLWTFPIA